MTENQQLAPATIAMAAQRVISLERVAMRFWTGGVVFGVGFVALIIWALGFSKDASAVACVLGTLMIGGPLYIAGNRRRAAQNAGMIAAASHDSELAWFVEDREIVGKRGPAVVYRLPTRPNRRELEGDLPVARALPPGHSDH